MPQWGSCVVYMGDEWIGVSASNMDGHAVHSALVLDSPEALLRAAVGHVDLPLVDKERVAAKRADSIDHKQTACWQGGQHHHHVTQEVHDPCGSSRTPSQTVFVAEGPDALERLEHTHAALAVGEKEGLWTVLACGRDGRDGRR